MRDILAVTFGMVLPGCLGIICLIMGVVYVRRRYKSRKRGDVSVSG